jgi:hypothetical protein
MTKIEVTQPVSQNAIRNDDTDPNKTVKLAMAVIAALVVTTAAVGTMEGLDKIIKNGPLPTAVVALIIAFVSGAIGDGIDSKSGGTVGLTTSAITAAMVVALSKMDLSVE